MEMNGTASNTNTQQQKEVASISKAKPGKLIPVHIKKGSLPYTSYTLLFAGWIQLQTQQLATADVGSRGQQRETPLQVLCPSPGHLGSAFFSSSPSDSTLQTW